MSRSFVAGFQTIVLNNCRIPFFFEPNFDAVVKPIPGALKTKARETGQAADDGGYKSLVYGEFLMAKVGNNFAIEGRDRYADN